MHQTDHHSTATSSSGSFKVFYSDLDLWALTVDQLKQHMKDLGIYHGCSHLRKEELIEKIKEFNHLVEEHHHHDHHGEKRKHNDSEIKKEESPKKEKVSDDILEEDLLHPHSFSSLSISKKEEPAEVAATTHHHITSSHKSKEHRKRRFVSSCPIKTQERIERALTQKLFLIERKVNSAHEQTFVVMGTTGNVYDVVIGEEPSCNCPDAENGNLCKHVLFVLLKVLRIEESSYLIYQHALLPSEIEEIFKKAPANNSMANSQAIATYKHLKGEEERNPFITSNCPICCDGFSQLDEQKEAGYCHCCGVNVHADCLKAWKGFNKEYPCPICKASKMGEGGGGVVASSSHHHSNNNQAKMNEGYLNLSEFQPEIKTTEREYVHSSRWNQRYGYNDDDESSSNQEDDEEY
ncbi:predicted protein [Naegleria gruberi]|uniref:Predicted protein n=1 Tax=Naegleria gruberi TaxID=5762 RepID=D2W4A0_NAEGR|nr:uncharacterized protein NAEGRDRAFT_76230 [Naegleria gruberi]EFC36102.1 predicted protein [Naegleria gruberi]|eukprot:XP_002668846.1 predicted protein [Naegleria gruberi strain NEG-M]